MIRKQPRWFVSNKTPDVIISSRVRLARNIDGFRFNDKLTEEDSKRLVERLLPLKNEIQGRENKEYFSCMLNNIAVSEKNMLSESCAVSKEFIAKEKPTGLIISDDEAVSISINDTDHIKIRSSVLGRDLKAAYDRAVSIDMMLDGLVRYVYSDKYGYLTSRILDSGTGLKASCLLFIPGFRMTKKLGRLASVMDKHGLLLTPFWGNLEDDRLNNFYVLSNRFGVGRNEQDILSTMSMAAGQIAKREKDLEKIVLMAQPKLVKNDAYRSYGILKYARKLGLIEALSELNTVMIGQALNVFSPDVPNVDFFRLSMEIQDNILSKWELKDPEEHITETRARYIRSKLPDISK